VSPALLNLPLPLLLWAAARFGPGGAGCATLLVAGVASWHALDGRGPFAPGSALDEVVALQLFLFASNLPLLFLAAAIRERNRAAAALAANEAALRVSYERIRELAGKLITAQEAERASIARDMHDDFNQQLAALAIEISNLRRRAPAGMTDALVALHQRTVALTERVRGFSHDLHPRMVGHVGLMTALRGHCDQMAREDGLSISFSATDDLAGVPRDTAVCVFRIVQEALRNVVAHAGVSDASVSIVGTRDRLLVTVTDCGRGFEPASTDRPGLGLLSMEERARAAGGSLTVTSGAGRGTTLRLQLPTAPS
jgi:two-component system sensor histidine kinase UhpB